MSLRQVFYCPDCLTKGYKNKLKVTDTREYYGTGFPSIKRYKKCLICGFKINTIEMELKK
jgi:transcriptional regulator NrdR family protein